MQNRYNILDQMIDVNVVSSNVQISDKKKRQSTWLLKERILPRLSPSKPLWVDPSGVGELLRGRLCVRRPACLPWVWTWVSSPSAGELSLMHLRGTGLEGETGASVVPLGGSVSGSASGRDPSSGVGEMAAVMVVFLGWGSAS